MRRLHAVSLVAFVAACASAPQPSAPRGAVLMQVGPGPDAWNDTAHCPLRPTVASMPDAYALPLTVAVYRSPGLGGTVGCSVHPEGQRFAASGTIAMDHTTSFSVKGSLDRTASELDVTFTIGGDPFTAVAPCTLDFTEDPRMDVATGRLWSTVTCPKVTDPFGATCFASAEFLLEDCDP